MLDAIQWCFKVVCRKSQQHLTYTDLCWEQTGTLVEWGGTVCQPAEVDGSPGGELLVEGGEQL